MDEDQTQDDSNPQDPQGNQKQLGPNQDDQQAAAGDQDLADPDDVKHQQSKPPSVIGEEDISGDMPAEPADLDEELGKIGRKIDPEHPEPLGEE